MHNIESTTDSAIEREIKSKGLTAPRVTPAEIEENIAEELYFTFADNAISGCGQVASNSSAQLLTFCVLILRNGFTVTGESACASPENFDAELGRKIARAAAVNKVWPLMGYALKQRLHEAGDAASKVDHIARVAHEVNCAYCQALGDDSQPAWEDAPAWQRESARMGTKLHLKGDFGPEASHIKDFIFRGVVHALC